MFCAGSIMQDGLDRQNDDMNLDIEKQKRKLKKLLDKVQFPFTNRDESAYLKSPTFFLQFQAVCFWISCSFLQINSLFSS
jgi:nucleolar complex protein 2